MEITLSFGGTVDRLVEQSQAFRRSLARTLKNSFTRTLRRTATVVKKDVRGAGIGRSIWGRNSSGLTKQKLIQTIEPRSDGDEIVTGLVLRGIPRIMELGGRLGPHRIKANRAKRLVFMGRAGTLVSVGSVNHPGARVRPYGFAAHAIRRNEGMIVSDLDASVAKALDGAFRG